MHRQPLRGGQRPTPGAGQGRRKATAGLHRAGRVTRGKAGEVPSVNHQGREGSIAKRGKGSFCLEAAGRKCVKWEGVCEEDTFRDRL